MEQVPSSAAAVILASQDVLCHVLQFVPAQDRLASCSRVSKAWHGAVYHAAAWRRIDWRSGWLLRHTQVRLANLLALQDGDGKPLLRWLSAADGAVVRHGSQFEDLLRICGQSVRHVQLRSADQ